VLLVSHATDSRLYFPPAKHSSSLNKVNNAAIALVASISRATETLGFSSTHGCAYSSDSAAYSMAVTHEAKFIAREPSCTSPRPAAKHGLE
jgi:hypothetical protein